MSSGLMSSVRMLIVVGGMVASAALIPAKQTQALELNREAVNLGIPDQEDDSRGSFNRRIAMSSPLSLRSTGGPEPSQVRPEPIESRVDLFKLALRILLNVRQLP